VRIAQRALETQVAANKHKSFRFKNNLVWASRRRGSSSAPGKPALDLGSPPEFRGAPGIWCPEEMLVAAVNGCLMLTFASLAESKGMGFSAYESAAEGLLENVDGRYRITEVAVHPIIVVKSQADVEIARDIMNEVENHCFISNSISAKVKLSPDFRLDSKRN
jgi:organic hydroperoxide reductase OsmC/OhrA